MIDRMAIAGMLFTLVAGAMVGGFVLLFPITRRLGAYLEQRLDANRSADELQEPQLREMRDLKEAVFALQNEVERIAERQEFTEKLLGAGRDAG
jgi:predicted  nucleic acid-binding Zn-ribbon protein